MTARRGSTSLRGSLTRRGRHEELEFSVSLGERPRVLDGRAELLVGLVHLVHRPHEYLARGVFARFSITLFMGGSFKL